MDFFRRTFARAGAFAFLGEAVAHVAVLTNCLLNLQDLSQFGFLSDWFFLLIGGYSAVGLWVYSREWKFKRCRTCFWYGFVTLFISATVLLHAYIIAIGDRLHHTLRPEIFPPWYSWIGLAYCLAFVWTLLRLKLAPREE